MVDKTIVKITTNTCREDCSLQPSDSGGLRLQRSSEGVPHAPPKRNVNCLRNVSLDRHEISQSTPPTADEQKESSNCVLERRRRIYKNVLDKNAKC